MNLTTYTLIKEYYDEFGNVINEIVKHVKLTQEESRILNYAYRLNNTNFRYIKLL